METPEEFLKHYHNDLPSDWLFEKREVVARLIKEYTDKSLRIHDVVGRSEQLHCEMCGGKIDKEDKFTEEKHCENCGWF